MTRNPIEHASGPVSWTSDDDRWDAVTRREPQADGAFFYAVKTTGVFCRPSCASRQPRRENVAFFTDAAAARAAGFRDCKRCQPGGLPRELAIVNRACAALDADPQQRLTLAQLSDAVHVSPFHLQRLFKRVVGVSPRQYQAAQRGAALRDALQSGSDVTRATLDAGFGSPSRMYDSASAELGMAPSAYRRKGAGLTVRYACAPTSLGVVLVAATDKGICKIGFGDDEAMLADDLRGEFANADLLQDADRLAPFIAQIDAYLRGSRQDFDLPLDIAATAFRQRVWDALRRIPYGETRSYSDIAEAVGSPRAVRAVASACATNPVALAIPCHRVVQKGGALAGYRWGLPRKAALLDNEAQHAGHVSSNSRLRQQGTADDASASAGAGVKPTHTKLDHVA
ncbi:bifunctional DNA-binding transcriptional regulator/O6-methylguanine-DNA methyltransferase Ada [Paraburkholderia bryophila]|uniref:bifunctional DNA-binding transcriptional regulator/O6-methylguanine-DNA methyltransferase Ada n=1 Tax=Burkholderiaceae TaxID=119060 RepID=UPI000555FAA4|nr:MULTISPECIES: bifunctional DNA-binding transcriptional regulator/O6-methylguanine-DNA methyltransferase Ada [Burkholderiaceae]